MLLNQGEAAPATSDNLVSDTTTQTFVKDVVEESRTRPVLVDFWAPWCGPCKTLTPVLEKTVRAAKGKVKLVKMNIDDHPAVAQQLGIQSIPTVFAFVNGQPVDGFMGALPEKQIAEFIERIAGKDGKDDDAAGGIADVIKTADEMLASGDAAGAADVYAQILAEQSDSIPALAGLIRAHVDAGNMEAAKNTLTLIPKDKEGDPLVVAARAALELKQKAAAVGDLSDLEAKVAANATDHQARFDLAVALNAGGQREQALDHLLEIVRRDRKWKDEAARKQVIQFFEAWGPADEMTLQGRRRLSAILFS